MSTSTPQSQNNREREEMRAWFSFPIVKMMFKNSYYKTCNNYSNQIRITEKRYSLLECVLENKTESSDQK